MSLKTTLRAAVSLWFCMMCAIACTPKHPVEQLQRQATRFDRQVSREAVAAFEDDRYLVPPDDALAATVTYLSNTAPVVVVQPNNAITDWSYDGTVGLDRTGEFFEQSRFRAQATLAGDQVEVTVVAQRVSQERRINADGTVGEWSTTKAGLDVDALRSHLGSLEKRHVNGIRAVGTPGAVLDAFEDALPSGVEVVSRDDRTLTAQRISTTTKEKKRGEWWARWDAREVFVVRVDATDGSFKAGTFVFHRFATEEGEGSWVRAEEVATDSRTTDWLVRAARIGLPQGSFSLGSPALAAVESRENAFTDPPDPPPLRTMAQIETAVRRRAFRTRTGNFTVCLDRIVVNPTDNSGQTWDVPALVEVLEVTESTSDMVSTTMGELNDIADEQPIVASVMDGGMMYLTKGMMDRHQMESIAWVTARVAGWTLEMLPDEPDISGVFRIGTTQFSLQESTDTLVSDQSLCETVDFTSGAPAMSLELWDLDLYYHDAIGSCTFDLGDVVDRGLTGVGCGFARAYFSAVYNFSFRQIAIVGLPRNREQ